MMGRGLKVKRGVGNQVQWGSVVELFLRDDKITLTSPQNRVV